MSIRFVRIFKILLAMYIMSPVISHAASQLTGETYSSLVSKLEGTSCAADETCQVIIKVPVDEKALVSLGLEKKESQSCSSEFNNCESNETCFEGHCRPSDGFGASCATNDDCSPWFECGYDSLKKVKLCRHRLVSYLPKNNLLK